MRLNMKHILILLFLLPSQILAVDYFNEGKKAFGARDYKKARELFLNHLKYNPGSGDPYFYLGYMQEYSGEKDKALEQYIRGVERKMSPELYEKTLWKIMLHYKYAEDWDKVIIYADKFLKYDDSRSVRDLKKQAESEAAKEAPEEIRFAEEGRLMLKEGRLEEARTLFEKSAAAKPDFEPALWNLALISIRMKEYEKARIRLQRLTELKPEEWEYHYKLGIAQYSLKQHKEALASFEKARSFNKEPGESFLHFINLSEGFTYLALEEMSRAKNSFVKALEHRSTGAVHGGLSYYYFLENEMEEAVSHANIALVKNETQKDALAVLCSAEYRKKSYSNALVFYEKLYSVALPEPEFLENRAESECIAGTFSLLSLRGKHAKAAALYQVIHTREKDFAKFIKSAKELKKPDFDAPAAKDRSYEYDDFLYYAANAMYHTEKRDAVPDILGEDPERAESLYLLALVHAEKGKLKLSADCLQKSLKEDPSLSRRAAMQKEFEPLKTEFPALFSEILPAAPSEIN